MLLQQNKLVYENLIKFKKVREYLNLEYKVELYECSSTTITN
jgi:hypothetical protein